MKKLGYTTYAKFWFLIDSIRLNYKSSRFAQYFGNFFKYKFSFNSRQVVKKAKFEKMTISIYLNHLKSHETLSQIIQKSKAKIKGSWSILRFVWNENICSVS